MGNRFFLTGFLENMKSRLLLVFGAGFLLLFVGIVVWHVYREPVYDLNKARNFKNIVPAAVIGGGPAGMSAAMYTARARIPTIVFADKKIGGELLEASYVENWPAKEKLSGVQMMDECRKQAEHFGAHVVPFSAKKVDLSSWPFKVTLNTGDEVYALTLIIATGGAQKLPEIPGIKEYWGKGIGICTMCDAPFDAGKDVFVVGGGDAAGDKALQLSGFAKNVTILVRTDRMRAAAVVQEYLKAAPNIKIQYTTGIEEIRGFDGRVSEAVISDLKTGEQKTVPIQAIYFALGFDPNSKLFKGQLKIDKAGYIKLKHCTHETSKQGVFAAGNVADSRYQKAGYAAGAGIGAGLDAIEFLTGLGFNTAQLNEWEPLLYKPNLGESIVEIESVQNLQKIRNEKELVGVIFHSQHCPVCRELLRSAQIVKSKLPPKNGIVAVDIQAHKDIADTYQVAQTPQLIILEGDREIMRVVRPLKADITRAFEMLQNKK